MTRKVAAIVAACVIALICGGLYAWPQYAAWRTRNAAPADGAEAEAKA
jgi:hypothetical protein